MRNLTVVTILSLLAFAAFGQSAPKWQVGTIYCGQATSGCRGRRPRWEQL
jgi:hypothetical protein